MSSLIDMLVARAAIAVAVAVNSIGLLGEIVTMVHERMQRLYISTTLSLNVVQSCCLDARLGTV